MKNVVTVMLVLLVNSALFSQCYPDRHNTSLDESWLSCQIKESPNPARGNSHWILYDFGDSYELGQSHFWNLNVPERTSSGISTAMIDYSLDGVNWNQFVSFNLAEANASGFYEGEDGPDLSGILAQYVLITITENHGGECFGFSEMRIATSGIVSSINELDQIINTLVVSPNPAFETATVQIDSEISDEAALQVVDMNGKIILERNIRLHKGQNKYNIDVHSFAAGQYMVNLNKEGKIKSTKLSIIHK